MWIMTFCLRLGLAYRKTGNESSSSEAGKMLPSAAFQKSKAAPRSPRLMRFSTYGTSSRTMKRVWSQQMQAVHLAKAGRSKTNESMAL